MSIEQRKESSGGNRKTFVTNFIMSYVWSAGKIVFAIASCGIATTLLQDGKSAHFTFKLLLNLYRQEQQVCRIKRRLKMAKVLHEYVLIVWDEYIMSNKMVVDKVLCRLI